MSFSVTRFGVLGPFSTGPAADKKESWELVEKCARLWLLARQHGGFGARDNKLCFINGLDRYANVYIIDPEDEKIVGKWKSPVVVNIYEDRALKGRKYSYLIVKQDNNAQAYASLDCMRGCRG